MQSEESEGLRPSPWLCPFLTANKSIKDQTQPNLTLPTCIVLMLIGRSEMSEKVTTQVSSSMSQCKRRETKNVEKAQVGRGKNAKNADWPDTSLGFQDLKQRIRQDYLQSTGCDDEDGTCFLLLCLLTRCPPKLMLSLISIRFISTPISTQTKRKRENDNEKRRRELEAVGYLNKNSITQTMGLCQFLSINQTCLYKSDLNEAWQVPGPASSWSNPATPFPEGGLISTPSQLD